LSKELTVTPGVQLVRDVLAKVTEKAARTLDGLYLDKDDPGYNPDAEKNWADCSMKTRAALVLVKQAQERGDGPATGLLGIVFVPARAASATEWEAMAKKVDEDERNKAAIDAEVIE
jgi:hypothetical protein